MRQSKGIRGGKRNTSSGYGGSSGGGGGGSKYPEQIAMSSTSTQSSPLLSNTSKCLNNKINICCCKPSVRLYFIYYTHAHKTG